MANEINYLRMKNIRYYAFWIYDFLKGAPVYRHYKEIETIFYGNKGASELQEKLLFNILKYAVIHTEFYNAYNPNEIDSFPVISKSDVIDNMEAIFSNEYNEAKNTLKTMSTSGSTGSPFKIYLDKNKVLRNKADLLFFYKIGDYNVGDRYYYMRIWTEMNKKTKMELLKENFRMFDTANLDKGGAESFVKDMTSDKNKKVIIGFPSSFDAIMDYIETDKKIDWNIKSIFTQAEELPVKVKKRMEKVFKCPVIARYSNQENGMLAQQPYSGENYFELNAGSYFIEFLKIDSDEPAEEMEEARIVVTDLFNKAVPMIRYDTKDIGIYSYKKDKQGRKRKVLQSIVGRKADYLYSNKRERLSPYIIITMMWKYTGIKQCQLIQEDYDKVTLKVVYRHNGRNEEVERQLSKEIIKVFGKETKLKIKNLEDIPREASGKRKYIISRIQELEVRESD